MKKFKELQKVYCLYINLTSDYISFKVEEGVFLGRPESLSLNEGHYVIEHRDDEVNYIQMDDIHETEDDALKALIKILQDKVNK